MIENMMSKKSSNFYPNHEMKAHPAGCLVTPKHSRIFPREPLVISRTILVDTDGSDVNGITPLTLDATQNAHFADSIASDLRDANLDPKGKLRSILFLRPVSSDAKKDPTYSVVRPCEATCFALTTSWDRDREHIGNGASRRYARNQGALKFTKHAPKSSKSGRDFWILPITILSADTISQFDQDWLLRAKRAIDEHAQKYPKDGLVATLRYRLSHPETSTAQPAE